MRILHLEFDQYPDLAIALLQERAEVVPVYCDTQEELQEFIATDKRFDVIFTRLGIMLDQAIIDALPELKYIVTSTTGLNHIDIDYAAAKNITLISLKGESEFLSSVKSTAEHTWMLVLSLLRNHVASHQSVLEGKWERTPFLADELDGKTLGIIGFGRLGKIVSRYGIAFGMNVLVNDHTEADEKHYGVTNTPAEQLVNEADVVILMISWSKENENFFDKKLFSKMKPSAYFINTARGELVNEADLLDALKNKTIKGAALDVLNGDSAWESEYRGNEELLNFARQNTNLLITPHMGGYGKDSIHKTRSFVVHKFINQITKA